jgi:environmental stress-induced protein Ves
LPAGRARRVAWRNGGGTTDDIDTSADPPVHLTLAAIERDGPFSDFSGDDRTIVLVEGAGFVLTFPDGTRALVDDPLQPLAFDGAAAPGCTLRDGPVRALNVIAPRGRTRHRVQIERLDARAHALDAAELVYVHVMDGHARLVRADGSTLHVGRGDTFRLRAAAGAGIAGAPQALVAIVTATAAG